MRIEENGSHRLHFFIFFSVPDATFSSHNGEPAFEFVVYLNGNIYDVGASEGPRVSSTKVVETWVSLFAKQKARDWGVSKVQFFLDVVKVFKAINGRMDCFVRK